MKPLPTVGGDTGTWGTVLNAFLAEIMPAGAMLEYAGAAAPSGWLLCDGTSYLRTDYNDLFTALGGASSPWGLPDGTHFNVPDMRGRMPVGKGTHTDVSSLAGTDGAASGSRTPKHKHTVVDATYGVQDTTGTGGGNIPRYDLAFPGNGVVGNQYAAGTYLVSGATVGPQTSTPTDGPAYVVVNYIIKT